MKEKRFSWLLAVTIAFCIIVLAAAPAAAADGEVYINDTSGTPYTSIQAAVDAAEEGDIILVSPGEYKEAVQVHTEDLTLKSIGGAAVTIIDSRDIYVSPRCIWFHTSKISIEGFTLKSKTIEAIYHGSPFSDGKITIKNNIIETAGGDGIHFV